MPAPAWMKYSLTSPFSNAKRSACTPIPKRWLTYDEADEKAYCRVNKIPYYKR